MQGKHVYHKAAKKRLKFYKNTFEKTTEDRRQKVFEVAVSEFAANGYNATNINVIAKKADISIGAMYSYFASKEDLFLTIVDHGFHILESALRGIDTKDGDIFDLFEKMLRAARDYAINYPEMNQIYLDLSTQGLSTLSSRLSRQLESITAELYGRVLNKSRQKGLIDPDADLQMVSFCLDNLIITFQFSFTSDYFKERMKIFLGEEAAKDEEKIIQGILSFVKKALSGR